MFSLQKFTWSLPLSVLKVFRVRQRYLVLILGSVDQKTWKSPWQNSVKTLYRSNNWSDLLLFNNKEIQIDGNLILVQTFQQKYNIKCNFWNYFQVLLAWPKFLLEKARTVPPMSPPIDTRNFSSNTSYQFSHSVKKIITDCPLMRSTEMAKIS